MLGRPEWGKRLFLNRVCVGPDQCHGPVVLKAGNCRHCSLTMVRPFDSSQPDWQRAVFSQKAIMNRQ